MSRGQSNTPGDARQERAASTLRKALDETLARGLADPRFKGMVSVTGVELITSERLVRFSVSIFPEQHESVTFHALKDAAGHLRREVMSRVRMRDVPRFEFILDRGLKNQANVVDLLTKGGDRPGVWGSPEDGTGRAGPETPAPEEGD